MLINRRSFLQSMGVLAAAGAVNPVFGSIIGPNKYEQTLALYDAAVALKYDPVACNQAFNTLMNFVLDNFPAPDITEEHLEATRKALEAGNTNRDISPIVIDEVYPVLVFKVALYQDKLLIPPRNIPRFNEFEARYGILIVCCNETVEKARDYAKWLNDKKNKVA